MSKFSPLNQNLFQKNTPFLQTENYIEIYLPQKKILNLRFIKGMTQVEVSGEIGISHAQVSRLDKVRWTKSKKIYNPNKIKAFRL